MIGLFVVVVVWFVMCGMCGFECSRVVWWDVVWFWGVCCFCEVVVVIVVVWWLEFGVEG